MDMFNFGKPDIIVIEDTISFANFKSEGSLLVRGYAPKQKNTPYNVGFIINYNLSVL